ILTIGSLETRLQLEKEGDGWKAFSVTDSLHLEVVATQDGWAEIALGGRVVTVPFDSDGERVEFILDGEIWRAEVSGRKAATRARHAEHSLAAPMPGQVLKIFVEVGDQVAKGDPLIVLEAMKMEHQITAPFAGLVESLACRAGDLVQPGIDLIVLVPEEQG
ncbi:MAG: biotin/lipoyl-binding protein, partial [Acidobacteria bacterium]|nr:biotin/lipoyl-binding protein [Acidobacteriota bacterium]